MHLHLDLVGGLSGDMFIGALLDAFPEYVDVLPQQLEDAGFADLVTLETTPANDGTLTGTSFKVRAGDDAHGHHHRHYSEIRRIIESSALDNATKQAALGIFVIIAEAEAAIHGKDIDDVAFHEVGAWDSIADIVCAASLIARLDASWSTSALPLGGGQVKTAHGMLPLPAPATALILKGFEFVDDGIEGERITPTGAAILKYLSPSRATPQGGRLARTGFGFGTKRFPGISNAVRLLAFEMTSSPAWDSDQVLELEFEIDDQTAEEVAWAVDRLRESEGVLDIVQLSALGKKGRQMTSLRVLATPESEDAVTRACFDATTTLGIRRRLATRAVLRRQERRLDNESGEFRVKIAERPGGPTVKVENDDLRGASTLSGRRALTNELERRGELESEPRRKPDD